MVLAARRFTPRLAPPGHPTIAQATEMIGNLIALAPIAPNTCAIRDLSGFEVYLQRDGKRFSALLGYLTSDERTEAPA